MKGNRKGLAALWLIVLCLAMAVTGTYAAYASIQNAKSVVVAKSQIADIRFSSNHMFLCGIGDTAPMKLISVGGQSDVNVAVTVCNFLQEDVGKVHDGDITYTLTAQLRDLSGADLSAEVLAQAVAALRLNGSAFAADGSLRLDNQTLSGGKASQNTYTITCPKDSIGLLSTLTIEMQAQPGSCDECHMENYQLKGRLRLAASTADGTRWSGSFVDNRTLYTDSRTLDAFNYEITGTAQETLTLWWDPDKVTLGTWSREDLPVEKSTDNSVTLSLGGGDKPTSYRLQFYRVNGIPEDETWNAVNGYVKFPYTGN